MNKVVFTKLFVTNLKDILDYIENDNSKTVADKIEASIMNAIELLQYFPNYGQIVVDKRGQEVLHLLVIGNYHVIYEYKDSTVYIHDIFDSRRNLN